MNMTACRFFGQRGKLKRQREQSFLIRGYDRRARFIDTHTDFKSIYPIYPHTLTRHLFYTVYHTQPNPATAEAE